MDKRIAFVTGASRGIGRAVALSLTNAGYDVVAAARTIEETADAASELRALNPAAMVVNLDVTSPDSIKAAFERAVKEKSRIDILVNNAGVTRDGLAMRM